jgi:hypothetical protein
LLDGRVEAYATTPPLLEGCMAFDQYGLGRNAWLVLLDAAFDLASPRSGDRRLIVGFGFLLYAQLPRTLGSARCESFLDRFRSVGSPRRFAVRGSDPNRRMELRPSKQPKPKKAPLKVVLDREQRIVAVAHEILDQIATVGLDHRS